MESDGAVAERVNTSICRTVRQDRIGGTAAVPTSLKLLLPLAALLATAPRPAYGWGGGGSDGDGSIFSNSYDDSWLGTSSAISLKLEGCIWSAVADNEDAGCLEDSSEDGTTYWYQMANCNRANVAYSLYATDSGSSVSCSSNTFKGSYRTKDGLAEFIYYSANYDPNSPFASSDDDGDDDSDYGDYYQDLPMCEESDGYYLSVGCGSDGTFTIDYFEDQYCLSRSGTYDTLDNLNYKLKTYRSCQGIYDSSSGMSQYNSLAYKLAKYSEACSSDDSALCTDTSAMSSRKKSTHGIHLSSAVGGGMTWANRMKYASGGLLLIASFIMFMGILFTNRRRRRALMQRKFRQSASKSYDKDDRSRRSNKSSRSKSRSRRDTESRRSKSATKRSSSRNSHGKSRSKSRTRTEKAEKKKEDTGDGGIFT